MKEELSLYVTPQVLLELFAVATSPKRVTKPIKPEQAIEEITKYLKAENIFLYYCTDIHKYIRMQLRRGSRLYYFRGSPSCELKVLQEG